MPTQAQKQAALRAEKNFAADMAARRKKQVLDDLVKDIVSTGGWSMAKTALDKRLPIKPWRLHDLRRTAATRMGDVGVLPHVVEAVLNHISGHRKGVAGIYNRAAYAAEKRAALDALDSYIKTALANADGANVRRLKKA